MRVRWLYALVLFVAPALACAQPLADKLPEGTILYFGWRGGDDPGPGYADSHLKAVLAESNLGKVFTQMMPAAIARIAREQPEAEQPLRIAHELMLQGWRKPLALAVTGIDYESFDTPMPKIVLLSKAGADAPALHQRISGLLREVPRDVPLKVALVDDTVVLSLGYADAAAAVAGQASLARNVAFRSGLEKVHADATLVFYVDVERIIAELDVAVGRFVDDEQALMYYAKIRDASGLKGVKRLVATSAFESRQWSTRLFVEAPAPRSGLPSIADGAPLDRQMLKVVPQDATFVATARFDAAKLVGVLRQMVNDVDPQFGEFFERGVGAASIAVGRNIETDLLEPLGEHWIAYRAPGIAGNSLLGTVVANKLDDADKAKQGLATLSIFLNNTVNTLLRRERAPVEIVGRSVMFGETRVYYVATPLISPSWAIDSGYLYLGLYPQTVAGAVKHASKSGPSILDNDSFKRVLEQLGAKEVDSLAFTDLPRIAPESYASLLALSRLVLGIGDLFGVPSPEPVVPTYDVIAANLAPTGAISWSDDRGFYARAIEPFPGSALLQMGDISGLVQAAPLMAGVLLPSMSRARETANRVKSASNLKQIGIVCLLHANENRGVYPKDLLAAAVANHAGLAIFDSPLGDAPGGDYAYLYFDGMKNSIAAEVVVAFDAAALDRGEGTNVLFGDGHVEWMPPTQFRQALQRSREIEPRSANLDQAMRLNADGQ
jgi:prepilin-type processing-associated H-X9-DG protein